MIASNVARSREANCVECGTKIDGGRYCDACLPANQTELEEQFDREHPVASGGPVDADDAEWERSLEDIEKSLTHDRKESAPQHVNSEDEHTAAAEKQPSSDKQESMRRVATVMRLQGESQTVRQLKRIIREECPGRQPGRIITLMLQSGMIEQDPAVGYRCYRVAAVDPERHAAQVAARASELPTVGCPVAGCSWVSSPGEPSRLKQKLNDHLAVNTAHAGLSRKERIAMLNKGFPGVPWPKSASSKKQTAARESMQPAQERIIRCPCGSVMNARSPKTQLDTLVSVHVESRLHESLNQMQKYELKKKLLPSHRWEAPECYSQSEEESKTTPISVHQAVQHTSLADAPVPAATSHKTLLLLDGTNGFSFAGSGAFLERTLKPFLESRALRVEITDTGELLRMTMEMRKEEKA